MWLQSSRQFLLANGKYSFEFSQFSQCRLSPGDLTSQCITGTLLDYNETLVHVHQVYYQELMPRLATHLLLEYLRTLVTRWVSATPSMLQ